MPTQESNSKNKRGGQRMADEDKKVSHHVKLSPEVSAWLEENIAKYKRSGFIDDAVKAAMSVNDLPPEIRATFVQDAIAEKLNKLKESITLP